MSRRLSYALAWLAVATIALVISWQGVSIVSRQVTTDRPATLSASELEESISAASPTTTTTEGSTSTESEADPSGTTTSTTASTATTPTSAAAGGAPSPTAPVPTNAPRTTGPTPSPTSTAPPSTATTTPPASTRTYNLVGGSAALRFSPSGVTVEYATPKPGFQVEIEPEHGNGVKVEFRSSSHRSRVDGWWENGPVDRVREEPED